LFGLFSEWTQEMFLTIRPQSGKLHVGKAEPRAGYDGEANNAEQPRSADMKQQQQANHQGGTANK
jgi:hypothetical protein